MATRLKTVTYAFAPLASVSDASVTNFTQITLHLPEGSKTFHSVVVHVTADDIITATGGTLTETRIGLRLAAVAYNTVTNTNDRSNSGEQISWLNTAGFTSYFNTNWTGTSMTCDVQVYFDQSTGTTLGMVNCCATIEITYEYDDTSTNFVQTAYIPLDAPITGLATSEPGTAVATIPDLQLLVGVFPNTFRSIAIVIQGNESRNGNSGITTDHTISMKIGSGATHTTGIYEGAMASDRWFRYVWDVTSTLTTTDPQDFKIWASLADRCWHLQIYMIVTYTFDYSAPTAWQPLIQYNSDDRVYGSNNIVFRCIADGGTSGATEPTWETGIGVSTTTDGDTEWVAEYTLNSLILPMEFNSPMGGITSDDYQRGNRDFMIQEPGDIITKNCAFFMFWTQTSSISDYDVRFGTGSFIEYNDEATVMAGCNGCMIRNDSGVTLARGRNELVVDIFRTDTSDLGWSLSGFFIINYQSALYKDGYGSHNHTVKWNFADHSTIAPLRYRDISAFAPVIPESNYYLNSVGTEFYAFTNGTSLFAGASIVVERLSGEGGIKWEKAYLDSSDDDSEVGTRIMYAQARDLFQRFPGDLDPERLPFETSRRWKIYMGNGCVTWHYANMMFTYHSISYTVSGTVADSNSGTVTLVLRRADDENNGERLLSTTRSGDGSYSFTWYDNTENVFVEAYEEAGYAGRSDNGLAV